MPTPRSMSTVPTSAEIQATLERDKARRRKGWRFFWIVIGLFILLLTLSPIIAYMAWQAQGRGMLRKELAAIPESEPLSTSEMTQAYLVPPGENDITPLWLAATLPFDSAEHSADCGELPFVGTFKDPQPTIDQPWPDPTAVATYLDKYQSQLAALHTAARTPGTVRYPRQFNKGISLLLPDVQRLRAAARALKLQLHQQLRDGQIDQAMETLRTEFALADTLEHDPILICMLVRLAITGMALQDALVIGQTPHITDTQLAQLQKLVRGSDVKPHLREALAGERAIGFQTFHLPFSALATDFNNIPTTEAESHRDGAQVQRPADCAMSLHFYGEMIDASEQPFPEVLDRMDEIEGELKQLMGGSPLTKFRYMMTGLLLPAMGAAATATGRSMVMREATDCLLAAKRYQLQHDKLPAALADLVPEFLPQVPNDPFDGQPLRFKRAGDELIVYSIGEDRVDNQGQEDTPGSTRPDIVVRMKLK